MNNELTLGQISNNFKGTKTSRNSVSKNQVFEIAIYFVFQKRSKKAGLNENINSVNRIFGESEPAN